MILIGRDPEFITYNMRFAVNISRAAVIIKHFPPSISRWERARLTIRYRLTQFPRLLSRLFINAPSALKYTMERLRPLVEERKRDIEAHGERYPGQPVSSRKPSCLPGSDVFPKDDMLAWFMEEVDGADDEEKLKHLAFHFLTITFGSVYPTTMVSRNFKHLFRGNNKSSAKKSFIQALCHLATRPEYTEPLRDEARCVISREGWSKSAMGEMRKLDSFLKESQRVTGLAAGEYWRPLRLPLSIHVTCTSFDIPASLETIHVLRWYTCHSWHGNCSCCVFYTPWQYNLSKRRYFSWVQIFKSRSRQRLLRHSFAVLSTFRSWAPSMVSLARHSRVPQLKIRYSAQDASSRPLWWKWWCRTSFWIMTWRWTRTSIHLVHGFLRIEYRTWPQESC